MKEYWNELQDHGDVGSDVDIDDYLHVDDQLAIGGSFSLAEIAQAFSKETDDKQSSDDEVTEIEENSPVTMKEARDGLRNFQRYVLEHFDDPTLLQMCDKFDDVMSDVCFKQMKQSKITDFTNRPRTS